MTPVPSLPPFGGSRSELPLAENPWVALWRTVWLDLPLAWADEVDRFLFRWLPPVGGVGADGAQLPDEPQTSARTVGPRRPSGECS